MMKYWIVMKYKKILLILSFILFFPFEYSNGKEGKFAKITWYLIFYNNICISLIFVYFLIFSRI